MAVPVVGDSGEGGAEGGAEAGGAEAGGAEAGTAMAVRIGDLRFVFGFEPTDSVERPQAQAAERPQAQNAERSQAQAAERSLALAQAAERPQRARSVQPGREAERRKATRTPGPYMNFCKAERPKIVKANPGINFGETGAALGAAWHKLSDAQKAEWGVQKTYPHPKA